MCPNRCNSNGRCTTIKELSKTEAVDNNSTIPGGVGDGVGASYTVWDAEITYGCVCDPGYTGPDCSLRECPHGDDPRTDHQQDRVIVITTGSTHAAEELSGTFYLRIGAITSAGFDANGDTTTAAVMKAHLEAMENVKEARVSQGAVDASKGSSWTVALKFAELLGTNNLFYHDGLPTLDMFRCDASNVAATIKGEPNCTITEGDLSVRRCRARAPICWTLTWASG